METFWVVVVTAFVTALATFIITGTQAGREMSKRRKEHEQVESVMGEAFEALLLAAANAMCLCDKMWGRPGNVNGIISSWVDMPAEMNQWFGAKNNKRCYRPLSLEELVSWSKLIRERLARNVSELEERYHSNYCELMKANGGLEQTIHFLLSIAVRLEASRDKDLAATRADCRGIRHSVVRDVLGGPVPMLCRKPGDLAKFLEKDSTPDSIRDVVENDMPMIMSSNADMKPWRDDLIRFLLTKPAPAPATPASK